MSDQHVLDWRFDLVYFVSRGLNESSWKYITVGMRV
jgi:hypothetical protein